MMKTERVIEVFDQDEAVRLCGVNDVFLRQVRKAFDVMVFQQDNTLRIMGRKKEAQQAYDVFQQMTARLKDPKVELTNREVIDIIEDVRHPERRSKFFKPEDKHPGESAMVAPWSEGQRRYIEFLEQYDIVFSIGPAGTGKTYLAVARALQCLRNNLVKKIILARPAVEAGEKLGFLPGGYQEKVNPYLRPLYDALNRFLPYQQMRRLMETEIIEVIPLAFMRGRNLDDAFMILDEGQNTTSEQMKMFLTRMGQGSKIVVTGDITQIDLPVGRGSGLVEAQGILGAIKGIAFSYLTRADIVRHPLVQAVVDAYEMNPVRNARKPKR